ncbi:MAG: type IV pilin protein [Aquabacterium sp.]|uniref:type IV pilin protein n=1 Tax=Aquabacterium sp. TaxID=1872578 RepID=UPI00271CD2F7|nr:type IV pilin protein [Aquabacterium sp.]MDO9005181.1 type IV pilin protein [Aquabacterium sp.]
MKNWSVSGRLARGFTLIELMIVVAIVGILASVALPAYNDYIRRGSLPDATSGLSNAQIRMEQYYQDHRSYLDGSTCGFVPPQTKYFTFTCVDADISATTYTLQASGKSGTAASGHVYTVNHGGIKATTKFKGADVSGKDCWMTKGDEC